MIFHTLVDANQAILNLAEKTNISGYYEGQFRCQHENIYIFEYKKSLPASAATVEDVGIVIEICRTEEILPQVERVLVTIKCDIVGISELDLVESLKRGLKTGEKRMLDKVKIMTLKYLKKLN